MFSTNAQAGWRSALAGLVLALAGWLALAGCGGSAPSREQSLNEGFRRIQQHEARMDAAGATAADPSATCEARAAAADAACDARGALCAEARQLADADALARCEQAHDACQAARGGAATGCSP